MTDELSQEKFIIWHTKKGSIDLMLISIFMAILIVIPLFQFLVSSFSTIDMFNKTRETLEIATISTYTKLNQESLSMGIMDLSPYRAKMIFRTQVYEMVTGNESLKSLISPDVTISINDGKIRLDSCAFITSPFKKIIKVEYTTGFAIDPIMEAS